MSAPRKYDQEFRDRAVRMYRDRLAEPPRETERVVTLTPTISFGDTLKRP